MTDQEWQAIEARHFPTPSGLVCDYDTEPWPCDVRVVLAEVERLREGLRAVLREHTPEAPDGRADRCRLCSPQEKRWPCSTVLEARAALEGKDG